MWAMIRPRTASKVSVEVVTTGPTSQDGKR
jgi:hypothetical protein